MIRARSGAALIVALIALVALVALVSAGCTAGRPPSPSMPRDCSAARNASTEAMSSPAEYDDRPISADAGRDYFMMTGGGDPYAAGIAYPILLALMEAYPDELGRDWNELADKFGLLTDPEAKGDPHAVPIGFHLTVDPNTHVPWVVANCQLCHAERIRLESGDVIVPGLGSKRVRPHAYANALMRIGTDPGLSAARITELATRRARAWNVPWPTNVARPIVDATLPPFKIASAKRASAVTRLAVALPGRVATIESFAIALEASREVSIELPAAIGWTKIPDVRGFPYRDTFSYDASGYGSPQALVLDADFVFGARPEWYATHPHLATSTYLYLKSFARTLPFPRPVDAALVSRGKSTFDARCARCHGVYVDHGGEMRVSYRERVVPKDVVGTDPARVDAVSASFVQAANDLPLTHGHSRVRNTGGYVPPVLLDVWARGLFGHAGQWPSLEVLAMPPAERPVAFVVDPNGLYDLDRVGVRYEAVSVVGGAPQHKVNGKLVPRPMARGEYLYEGDRLGYKVDGHTFLSDLPEGERRGVIEYLKTLSSK